MNTLFKIRVSGFIASVVKNVQSRLPEVKRSEFSSLSRKDLECFTHGPLGLREWLQAQLNLSVTGKRGKRKSLEGRIEELMPLAKHCSSNQRAKHSSDLSYPSRPMKRNAY